MPRYPATEAEAAEMLGDVESIKLMWCRTCQRLVIPIDRLQERCPECGDWNTRATPSARFVREL